MNAKYYQNNSLTIFNSLTNINYILLNLSENDNCVKEPALRTARQILYGNITVICSLIFVGQYLCMFP